MYIEGLEFHSTIYKITKPETWISRGVDARLETV